MRAKLKWNASIKLNETPLWNWSETLYETSLWKLYETSMKPSMKPLYETPLWIYMKPLYESLWNHYMKLWHGLMLYRQPFENIEEVIFKMSKTLLFLPMSMQKTTREENAYVMRNNSRRQWVMYIKMFWFRSLIVETKDVFFSVKRIGVSIITPPFDSKHNLS